MRASEPHEAGFKTKLGAFLLFVVHRNIVSLLASAIVIHTAPAAV